MYLEIFQYDPEISSQVEKVQQEIRDFTNHYPQFEIVKIETLETYLINDIVTIHCWYKEK